MKTGKPYKILVLCTGNICRSPVAEAMLASMLGPNADVDLVSAGLAAPVGHPPHGLAVKTAAALGFTIDPGKQSRPVLEADVATADLILVMELRQKHRIQSKFPSASGKVFMLGHWGEGEITDPIGQPLEVFVSVAQKIEAASRAWCLRLPIG